MKLLEVIRNSKFGKYVFSGQGDDKFLIIKKQQVLLFSIVLFFLIITFVFSVIYSNATHNNTQVKKEVAEELKIRTSKDVLNQDQIWNEYFENKMKAESDIREKEKSEIISAIEKIKSELIAKQNESIENLKSDMEFENSRIKAMIGEIDISTNKIEESKLDENIDLINLDNDTPKNIHSFIPAGTFVSARLLAGISVPTGVTVQSDPFPVIIQVTSDAIAPNDENINLKSCRVIGSCYGNISSERAIIRLETLSCVNNKTKSVLETKIVGYVVGPDGLPGIRGKVISMDKKHVQNAVIGGLISGLAKTTSNSGDEGLSINLNGKDGKQKESFFDKLQGNSVSGVGQSSDKIANYFIKKAESIQEVIEVAIGTQVNVVFSGGVYFGANDTKQTIENQRNLNTSETNVTRESLNKNIKETRDSIKKNKELNNGIFDQRYE